MTDVGHKIRADWTTALAQYCRDNGLGPEDVAPVLGVAVRTAYRYLSGERFPSPAGLEALRKWSNGKLTANDFYHPTGRGAA
jgi:hypothetical protein